MPNGGESDENCYRCGYNKAMQDYGLPDIGEHERYERSTYCTLRKVAIWGAFTYCANYALRIEEAFLDAEIKGPIKKLAPYTEKEDHSVLIPWYNDIEPLVTTRVRCEICQKRSHKGIRLDMPDGSRIGFCSKEHYVEWINQHPPPYA